MTWVYECYRVARRVIRHTTPHRWHRPIGHVHHHAPIAHPRSAFELVCRWVWRGGASAAVAGGGLAGAILIPPNLPAPGSAFTPPVAGTSLPPAAFVPPPGAVPPPSAQLQPPVPPAGGNFVPPPGDFVPPTPPTAFGPPEVPPTSPPGNCLPVPEPSSFGVFAVGVLALFAARRKARG